MVQALATVGAAAGSAARALSQQSKSQRTVEQLPSSTEKIASAQQKKIAELAYKNAREERLLHFIEQPQILGLFMTFAGVLIAQTVKFTDDKFANEIVQSAMTTTSVLMGLGYAGVGDLTTLAVAGMAGIGSLLDIATTLDDLIGDAAGQVRSDASSIWNTITDDLAGLLRAIP